MWELLFLLLPLAAFSGWLIGRRRRFTHHALERLLGFTEVFRQRDKGAAFVKWLESNQETLDTHLTLEKLFRGRGEVDKAVGIHQNLMNKPSLTAEQRAKSRLELARDYMRAGILDRAEQVLLELVKEGSELQAGFQHLIDIYQQSKDWLRAIEMAETLQAKTKINMNPQIAHFYCELAEQRWLKGELDAAHFNLKQALEVNKKCVRASILLGNMEANAGHFKTAIKAYQQVQRQDQDFLSEVVFPLAKCFENMDNHEGMVKYLSHCLAKHPTLTVVLAFSDWLNKTKGNQEAAKFIADHLRLHPSIRGLSRLLQFSVDRAEGVAREDLQILQELIQKLVANKPLYRCQSCGFSGRTLQWQCPGCKRWDVIKPIHE